MTDVTSYVHHKLPVSFLLYIATKKTCQINQIITVNSSMNAPIVHKKIALVRLACLCFPPAMDWVTLSVVSDSLNISQKSTKLFSKYSRSIIHTHKWDTPPERIYVDMRCQGIASSPAQGRGHLILYGIVGRQNDIDSAVYDNPYDFKNNKMTFHTDIEFEHGIDVKNIKIGGVLEGTDDDNASQSVGGD